MRPPGWQAVSVANVDYITGGLLHSFQYNAQGDTTAKNSALYSFDAAHRLLSVANVASYSYDGHGRRIKETPQGGAAQYQVYSRAGQRLITGDITTGNRFIYLGNTLLALDNYANGALGNRLWMHTDALGSVVVRTLSDGTIQRRHYYAPYGEPYNSTILGLGYTGHDMDADTGLVYMQQRYYDPSIGRFLSNDPVSTNANSGDNFNRYWYANNNPYKFTDPDGRAACAGSSVSTCVEASTRIAQLPSSVELQPEVRQQISDQAQTQAPSTEKAESLGFLVKGGNSAVPAEGVRTATLSDRNTATGSPPAGVTVTSIIHAHIDSGPNMNPGFQSQGDATTAYKAGVPNAVLSQGRVGVNYAPDGRLRLEVLSGTMSRPESKAVQKLLDQQQRALLKEEANK